MKKTRQSVIQAKKDQALEIKVRKVITTLNTGMVLMSATAALDLAGDQITSVEASSKQKAFIRSIADHARSIAKQNDLYASVMIAQAALESGWGQSQLAQAPNYNLFGIKGEYEGESVDMKTYEDDGQGNYYQITDGFRKYPSYAESLHDYAHILTGDHDPNSWRYNFYAGARMSNTKSYHDATAHLTGRYATDTSYGSKLNQLIHNFNLTQYDARVSQSDASSQESSSRPEEPSVVYQVQPGDYLYKIATRYGITVDELKEANGLTDNLLLSGVELKIPGLSARPNRPSASLNSNASASKPAQPSSRPSQETSNRPQAQAGYTVQPGDSYYGIASKYGISIAELQRLNGATSYLIHPGQVLKVPSASSLATPKPNPEPSESAPTRTPVRPETNQDSAPQASGKTYVVQAGDSYWKIANQYGMTIEELQRLNGANDYLIHPGQELLVHSTQTQEPVTQPSQEVQESSLPTRPSAQAQVEEVEVEVEAVDQTLELVEDPVLEPSPSPQKAYTVQAGDTLYSIANRHGLDVYQLIEENQGTLIHPGQVLDL